MKLLFATQNQHKITEIQNLLGDDFELISLKDINFTDELLEEQPTLEGNATQKSTFVYEQLGYNCFADDTGLEIEALNNAPGVLSARYAGEDKDAESNMNKVLQELQDKQNRNARFRTVISLIIDGKETQFEGIVEGTISKEKKGSQGFGYDPIFIPNGYKKSFAQLSLQEKNNISHRGRALKKLVEYLKNYTNA